MNYKGKSRCRFFLLMRSRTPPISSEFRGGLNPPNHPLGTPLLIVFLEEALLKYNTDTNFIIIFNNNNNNNVVIIIYGRLQDLILPFKIPRGTRKDFFEICRKFGHASSNKFASPAIQYRTVAYLETLRCS